MKILQVLIVVLLSGTSWLTAQELYLPVSSKSEEAKAAYAEGLAHGERVIMRDFFAQMEKAYELDDRFFFAVALPSLHHRTFGNTELADQMRDKALAIKPKGFTPAEKLVRKMLQTAKDSPGAKLAPIGAELVAAYPDNPQAHEMAMMMSFMADQDTDGALQYAERLVELRPDYAGAQNMLGYIYMAREDMPQAKAHFDKYLAMAPQDANAYDSMAEYYLNAGDYAQSARMYERAAEMGMKISQPRAEQARAKLREQAPAERYVQQGEEIEWVQSFVQAYNAGDWKAMEKMYTADAEIFHNSMTSINASQIVAGLQQGVDGLHTYTMAPMESERVVTDEGETWVNLWCRWEGQVTAEGDPVVFPVHVTIRFVDGKIAEEHAYYNADPLETARAAAAPAPIHYVEMWNAKPAWTALSEAGRNEFMAGIGPAIEELAKQGGEVVSFVMNDAATARRQGYDIFAIWSFPDAATARNFEGLVEASGWHDYFEQYNMSGKALGPEAAMKKMVKMK